MEPRPPDAFLNELASIFPAGRLLTRNAELMAYKSDALTAYRVRPYAVVIPERQDEVIDAVRVCSKFKIPFVARGVERACLEGHCPQLMASLSQ